MQHHKWLAALGAVTALAALNACSSSGSPTSPSNDNATLQTEVSNDAAASTGQAVVSDINETGGDVSSGGSWSVVGPHGASLSIMFAGGGSNCSQTNAPSDLRWYCLPDTTTISHSGTGAADTLIRTRNYEFFAAGAAQSTMNTSTDSINFGGANGMPVYVAIHRPHFAGVSHRVRNHSVVDHPSFTQDTQAQSTWNGNTLATDTATYTGTIWTVGVTGVAYDTTANVVYQRPRSSNPFPISGEFRRWANWSYSASGPAQKSGTVSRHIVVTFNGTQTAQLQVIGTTTLTCDLNLVTGDVSNCH